MKLLNKLLLITTIICLSKSAADTTPIPVINKINDIAITEGDYIKFPIGGYIGGANTKYSISDKHKSGTSDTNGVNVIQRVFDAGTLKMKDTTATGCTLATRISDNKFFVLCNKVVHYVQFTEDPKTNKKTLDSQNSWSRMVAKDATDLAKVASCYDVIEYQNYALVACTRTPEEGKKASLHFAFVNKDRTDVHIQEQSKDGQIYENNLKMTLFKNSGNHYLILRTRFSKEATPSALYRSFKTYRVAYVSGAYQVNSETFVDISQLKENALSTSGAIGATIDIRNIESDEDSGIWISGTDFVEPPKPPALNQTPTAKAHNVIKAYRIKVTWETDKFVFTPYYKGNLVIPFEKDEKIEKCAIRMNHPKRTSSNEIFTIITKQTFYEGSMKFTAGSTATDADTLEYVETKKAQFLCPSDYKNKDSSHISDIQLSNDGRGLFVATHFDNHEQSESLGLFDTITFNYDCIDNSNKNGYEVLTDYNTLIIGRDATMTFMDIAPTPYIWFNYEGISKNTNFVKGTKTEVTLTATNKIVDMVDRKGELKFNITVYDQWSAAAMAQEPYGGAITGYEKTWMKLPYTPRVVRANNPVFTIKEDDTVVQDENKVKIMYSGSDEIKLDLTGLTGLPDRIFNADANTFVAVKYTQGQSGKFWVFDCDTNKSTMKYECQKAAAGSDLESKDHYITNTGRIGKYIFIVQASMANKDKVVIRYVNDETKELNNKKSEISDMESPIFFNNKEYGFMVYLEDDSGTVGNGLQNQKRIKARYFYVTSNGIPELRGDSSVVIDSSKCFQNLYYDDSHTPDKYRTILVKSHCMGQKPEIIEYKLNEDLDSSSGVMMTRRKEVNSSGFTFCPAGKEGFMFSLFGRSLKSFSWDDDSTFDYNLYKVGITEPLMMNCISERNTVQIIGKNSAGAYLMATFIGGSLADPTRRVHNIATLSDVGTNKINSVATAYNPMMDRITTLISYTGTTTAEAKRYAYQTYITGPIVYYSPSATGTKSISLEAKTAATVVKSVVKVISIARQDTIQLEVVGKVANVNGKMNLDNQMKLTGHIVNGVLSGPSDIIGSKVVMSNSRKNETKGFKAGTDKVYDQLEVVGTWMVGLIKGKNLEFINIPGNGTEGTALKNYDGVYESMRIIQHPTISNATLVVAREFSTSDYGRMKYSFFHLSYDSSNKPSIKAYSSTYRSIGTFIESDYQFVFPNDKELYLIEAGPGGHGFTFKQFSYYSDYYGWQIVNSDSTYKFGTSSSVTTDYRVKSFSTLWLRDSIVVIYSSEEIDTLAYIVYTRGSTPITYRTKVHETEQITPGDLECKLKFNSTTELTCFIDAVGERDVLMNYTIATTGEFSQLFAKKEKAATYLTPPGFEAVKIQRTDSITGILFKNLKVQEVKKRLMTEKSRLFNNDEEPILRAAKTIYECEHVLGIYKPGSEYAYITFTCDDFGSPKMGVKVDFTLESGMMGDKVWLTNRIAPAALTSKQRSLADTTPIKSYGVGQFEVDVKDPNVDMSKVNFQAVGNDGTSAGGTKSLKDFQEGKKPEGGSSWWIWLLVILLIIIIVAVVFVVMRKGSSDVQQSGSYVTAPKGDAKEDAKGDDDMDDSRL